MPFDGFISYSHAADGRLAPAVQRGLHRLARPWHRRRALWIFRDQTGLAVTPGLWSSIQTALDGSQYFVLLASPEAARSPWVNKEIEHWVATKSPQRILPVLTDGEWSWDAATGDFTDGSTAVPDALRGVFAEEPLYLDLRWARDDLHLSLRHARFRDSIAQLAAPMHGVSKDELESEDVRQHRRARRLWSGAMAAVVLLALVASMTGVLAIRNAGWANASAVEAQRQQQNARTQEGQAQAAAAETRRQEQLAEEQRALADEAAADAAQQQENATEQEQNARRQQENARRYEEDARRQQEDARRQREDARRQKENARRSQEDARRQQQNARRSAKDASEQQKAADEAEARAEQQEKLAREHEKRAEEATEERRRQEKIAREQEKLAREAAEEARRQREEVAAQRRSAVNQRLLDRARAMLEFDPKKGLMLGVVAERLQPDDRTRSQLSNLVRSTHYAGALTGVAGVTTVASGALVTADTGGTVSVWDVSQPARAVRLGRVPTAGPAAKTLVSSPDGTMIAVLDGASPAVVWNLSDPARPARVAEFAGAVTLSFSPDGHTVATSDREKNTTLWDVRPGTAPAVLSTIPGAHSLTFGPEGRTAATSGATATLWDLADLANPVRLATIADALPDGIVVLNPKRAVVMVEEKQGLIAPWDLRDITKPYRGLSQEDGVGDAELTGMEFSPDGWTLAISDSSGTMRLRNLTIGSAAWTTGLSGFVADLVGRDGPVRSTAFSRDGKLLISAGDRGTGTLWNVRGAFPQTPKATLERPRPADVTAVAVSPDGRTVFAADSPGTMVSYDVTDPAKPVEHATVSLDTEWLHSMDISPDGRTIAVADIEGAVTVFDVTRPDRPERLAAITDADEVAAIAFSPDGTLAVGRYPSSKTTVYDLTDRTKPVVVAEVTDRGILSSIEFSADGHTMAVSAGYNVTLWDMTARAAPVRHTELSMDNSAFAAAFSPDGRTLAVAAGYGGTTVLWDIADLAQPHRLGSFMGAQIGVRWLGFSPDGSALVTSSLSEARLWDVRNPSSPVRIAALADPQMRPYDLMFSPDGRTLVAGGSRWVTLWDYTAPAELRADPRRHACAITGRGLNAEEWARYVPELEHRPTC